MDNLALIIFQNRKQKDTCLMTILLLLFILLLLLLLLLLLSLSSSLFKIFTTNEKFTSSSLHERYYHFHKI